MDTAGIQDFFAGKSVLLTGVTGLVGKLVLEKLLRSCERLDTVYVVIRPKKDKGCEQRLKELCELQVFEGLREKLPGFERKIVGVEGDFERDGFSLREQDLLMLQQKVDCVIHCAAAVRFNETLKKATVVNVKGTRDVLELARRMERLKAFVYVSTAFSFCPRRAIDEVIYDVPLSAEGLITTTDILDEKTSEEYGQILIKKWKWPNSYSFTKAVTEDMIGKYTDLPIAIVRPSILLGCAKEPLPGWTDNVQGIGAIMLGVGLGIIRIFPMDPSKICDIFPVDYAVNLILAAAWAAGRLQNGVRVFNCVSGPDAPLEWGKYTAYGVIVATEVAPSTKMFWYPFCFFVHPLLYSVFKRPLHILPGYLFDSFAVLAGRPERLRKVYKKVDQASSALTYFSTKEWAFKNANTKELWSKLSEEEKQLFNFNAKGIDWTKFVENVSLGLRLYIAKEPMETAAEGKSLCFKMKIANYFVGGSLLIVMFVLLYRMFLFML